MKRRTESIDERANDIAVRAADEAVSGRPYVYGLWFQIWREVYESALMEFSWMV